jgi:hypothetical protein
MDGSPTRQNGTHWAMKTETPITKSVTPRLKTLKGEDDLEDEDDDKEEYDNKNGEAEERRSNLLKSKNSRAGQDLATSEHGVASSLRSACGVK